MPRTPRKKETKNPIINEEVKKPEPEPEVETEQIPEPEPVAEHRNYLMHEKQSFSSHQPEQHPSTDEDIELEIPKKRPKQRSEKQLEQLRLAREKSLANKEMRRKQKEEEEQKIKQELEATIQAEKKAIEQRLLKKRCPSRRKKLKNKKY